MQLVLIKPKKLIGLEIFSKSVVLLVEVWKQLTEKEGLDRTRTSRLDPSNFVQKQSLVEVRAACKACTVV